MATALRNTPSRQASNFLKPRQSSRALHPGFQRSRGVVQVRVRRDDGTGDQQPASDAAAAPKPASVGRARKPWESWRASEGSGTPKPASGSGSTSQPASGGGSRPRPASEGSSTPKPASGGGSTSRPVSGDGAPMPASAGKDKYVGVQPYGHHLRADSQKYQGWRAKIRVLGLGSLITLGTYARDQKRDAAQAYDAACYLRDGGRGVIKNFPDDYKYLTVEQGTARAKDVLGPEAMQKLQDAFKARDEAPPAQGQQPNHKPRTSVGVRFLGGLWAAQIQVQGKVKSKSVHLGSHRTEEGAQRAYAAAWFLRDVYLDRVERARAARTRTPPPFCKEEYDALPQQTGIAKAQRLLAGIESLSARMKMRPLDALMEAIRQATS